MKINIPSVLFHLSGMGDTDLFFASKEALDWVMAPGTPGDNHLIPENVKQSLKPFFNDWPERQEELNRAHYLSSGTFHNDKALILSGICKRYDSVKEAMQALASPDNIIDEYEGYIY